MIETQRTKLRSTLLKAVALSDLGPFQKAMIRVRSRRDDVLEEVQQFIIDSAVEQQVMSVLESENVLAIDWDKLLDFIVKLIPLILQIISIFL